jgi:hypothetical protein
MHWSNEKVEIEIQPGVMAKKEVWKWLREIVQQAQQAEPPCPNIDLIIYLAFKCCANDHGQQPVGDHDLKLTAAVLAAQDGLWSIVAYELDHDV